MSDLGLSIVRLVVGSLLAGHGAQKLFGSFGGPGLSGVTGWLESLGLRPGHVWAWMAGLGEFGGGSLTLLGLGGPLGQVMAISAMLMAAVKGHWGKPIWVTAGGAELPVTNIAIGTALALAVPGRYSLDRLFGLQVPRWTTALVTLSALGTVAYGMLAQPDADEAASEPTRSADA